MLCPYCGGVKECVCRLAFSFFDENRGLCAARAFWVDKFFSYRFSPFRDRSTAVAFCAVFGVTLHYNITCRFKSSTQRSIFIIWRSYEQLTSRIRRNSTINAQKQNPRFTACGGSYDKTRLLRRSTAILSSRACTLSTNRANNPQARTP